MNWKKPLIAAAAAILLFGGGVYTGRTMKPAEVKHEESAHVEQKQEKQAEAKLDKTEKGDIKVADKSKSFKRKKTVIDMKPDGSKHIEHIEDSGTDKDVKMDVQYVTSIVYVDRLVEKVETKVDTKSVTIEKNVPAFTGGIHAGYNVLDIESIYPKAGAHGSYRLLGPVHLNGDITMRTDKLAKPEVNVGVSWEF